VLSRMDFLINLDNNSDTQLPSKLIDYSFTGRPVLNITSGMNFSTLQKFMEGDYSKRMILESSTNYDIVVVANKFISLLDS